MMDMTNFWVRTRRGQIVMTAENRKPRVLMIHGFGRRANQLFDWRERIPDLGFVHLPGHSGPATLDASSMDVWIEGFTEFMAIFPEPPLVIAESLGAVLAMCVPTTALIAIDPILSTEQLWPIRRSILDALARGEDLREIYEALFPGSFAWVLDRISAPTLVLAGSVPLMPERDVAVVPSALTDEDLAAYGAHPLVEARRIEGGHLLLDQNADGVLAGAAVFMQRHGYL